MSSTPEQDRPTPTTTTESSDYGSFGLPEGMSEDDVVSRHVEHRSVVIDPRGLSYRAMLIGAVLLLVVVLLMLLIDVQRASWLPGEMLRGSILSVASPALPFVVAASPLLAPIVIVAAAYSASRLQALPKAFALMLVIGAFLAFGLTEFVVRLVAGLSTRSGAPFASYQAIEQAVGTTAHALALVLLLIGVLGVHLTGPAKGWQKPSS